MARSSTTRHGTGSCGPARGDGNKGKPGPGRPVGMKTGEGKKATFRQLMAPHIEETAKRWLALINDPSHPHHHTMVLKHAELEGEMKQSVELEVRKAEITDEPITEDEWIARHAAAAGLGSAAGSAEGTD